MMLGHERLISRWPISTGPTVVDDVLYVSAGVWPFMGLYFDALDPASGKVLWTNDEAGFLYRSMTKGHPEALSLSGPTPQGYLAVTGDFLLVPCGRSLPACFDRRTGKFLFYDPTAAAYGSSATAGTNLLVSAARGFFFCGQGVFDAATGQEMGIVGPVSTFTPDLLVTKLGGLDLKGARLSDDVDWRKQPVRRFSADKLFDAPGITVHIKAGSRLFGDRNRKVVALAIPKAGEKPAVSWSAPVPGTVTNMIAANGRLIVVTSEGKLLCFASGAGAATTPAPAVRPPADANDAWTAKARQILDVTKSRDGYAVVLGIGTGRLAEELTRQSNLTVIALDPDAGKVAALRRRMDEAGLYGSRIAALEGTIESVDLPPWFASLIVSEGSVATAERVFRSLRPYGGSAWLELPADRRAAFVDVATRCPGAKAAQSGEFTRLARVGPLPGAGSWTHDNADPARTLFSRDSALKAPLAVLWYGGPSGGNIFINPGWLGGPSPLVVGGRLIVQGRGAIYALDVYTGRILWRSPIAPTDPLCATRYVGYSRDYAFNWAAAPDALYVADAGTLVTLDMAHGARAREMKMPQTEGRAYWGSLIVMGDVIVAAACRPTELKKLPTDETRLTAGDIVRLAEWIEALAIRSGNGVLKIPKGQKAAEFADATVTLLLGPKPLDEKVPELRKMPVATQLETADGLVAIDRKTGAVLWRHAFAYGCLHDSALVASGDKVFCLDGYSVFAAGMLRKRGKLPADYAPKIVALDLRTGAVVWRSATDVVPAGGLSVAAKAGLLLQAGGRVETMRYARKVSDGSLVWKQPMEAENYGSWHPSIVRDDILLNHMGYVFDVLTGTRRSITNPLTGVMTPWTMFTRTHGCGHAVASENMVTVRVGNAAYADLLRFDGTRSLGGFRSSCQNNLIPADGVLAVPRYSTCRCAYPIYTSLALVNDPDVETWSIYGALPVKTRVLRVGLNLGAPGDRMADDGTLWLDCPSVSGPSPDVPVEVEPKNVSWFRHWSGTWTAEGPAWVASSGAEGVRRVAVTLAPDGKDERAYTVRLHFAEPMEDVKPGDRVFDVAVQGAKAVAGLDVVRDAGRPRRGIVRELRDVMVRKTLVIELTPSGGTRPPILSGVEIREQEPVR